jgi:nitrogen PTS system EIIA component
MNHIAELLPEENVVLGVSAASKPQLFDAIGRLFEGTRGLSRNTVVDSLTARERLGSTGLGQGIAIPHGRIKGLTQAQGAFARLAAPIPFDAPDGKPVSQVFVLLVPEQATEQHLQLLSELAEMFSDRAFRDALAHASSTQALHHLFTEWKSAV